MRLRSRIVAVTVPTVVLLIALSACTAEAPDAVQTPGSTPSASRTVIPTPSPTPAPTQDPADPSTWIITTTSIGPAELGVSEDEFVAALAPSFVLANHCEGLTAYDPVDPTLGLGMSGSYGSGADGSGQMRAAWLFAEADPVGQIPNSPRTESGVTLGSSLDELRTAYPTLELWADPRDEGSERTGDDYVVAGTDSWLIFFVKNGFVKTITATLDLPPVGFCS